MSQLEGAASKFRVVSPLGMGEATKFLENSAWFSELSWETIPSAPPLISNQRNLDPQAVDLSGVSSGPLIGVIDTGFNLDALSLLQKPLYLGYDWIERDFDPLLPRSASLDHGTQVLKQITQVPKGVAKVADETMIWLGRAVGSGHWADSLVEFVATSQALGHRRAIANLSFDLTQVHADGRITARETLTERELSALHYAEQAGVIVVAAAGNEGTSLSALAQASQQFDNIITVGAAEGDQRATYSNHGAGLMLVTELLGSAEESGTSLAAAQVTRAVEQVWQAAPELSDRQVIELLTRTATDLNREGWDGETGYGKLNVERALEQTALVLSEKSATVQRSLDWAEEGSLSEQAWMFASQWFTQAFERPQGQFVERALALDVASVMPGTGTTNIDTRVPVRIQFATEVIDQTTLTSNSFQLLAPDGSAVAATIGSDLTGGVLSLTPLGPLDPFTTYQIVITDELLNSNGEAATPFRSIFTTGARGSSLAGFRFNNQQVLANESRFGVATVAVGPDSNVYASDINGNILRYLIDPSTGLATGTETVFSQSGSQILGLAFDPDATATNLQLWISYTPRVQDPTTGQQDLFAGTISKLTLPLMANQSATKQDYIVGLPNTRFLEHQVNGITFGPDGKLYQSLGGVATLGGTPNWFADESLLSASVAVADVKNPNFPTNQTGLPVDAQTVGLDNDNDPTTENYDPFAANAPVTLFATGLRNAYDLAWHSNGNLYSGINQNSTGINLTPASPDGSVPAINARPDEMLALIQEGKYYGHPNPSRAEYVLNGGNPTGNVDPREVTEYPVGVQPDPDFDASLIFNTRPIGGNSPNGLTEYMGAGPLNGHLLVSFFSGARTIQSFELGADGLVRSTAALQDTSGNPIRFKSPLDVAVHPSGRIYVADFGNNQGDPNDGALWVLDPVELPGVIVTPSSGTTDVTEAGGTDTYSIALATQPTGLVTIAIGNDGQLSTDTTTLTFTPANWDNPQIVTVSAVDDNVGEGSHTGSISHSISSSGDINNYPTTLAIESLTANITDNEDAGLIIVQSNGETRVTEGGASDNYTVVLTNQPTSDVIVTLNPDGQLDLGNGADNTIQVIFTPANWNDPQTVTVTAVEDSVFENGLHSGAIAYGLSSSDARYNGLAVPNTSVAIIDNDLQPAVLIQQTGGSTQVSEAGVTDSYEIVLAAQPTANVTITLDFDSSDLAVGQSVLSFTPSNWDVPQTVQLSAVDDALREGAETRIVSHRAASADSDYNGISIADLSVAIVDNDGGGNAVFIAGSSILSGADVRAREILEEKGFTVTVVDDDASQTGNAANQDLVVISQSVSSGNVSSKFTNVPVPVVVWESFLYDELGMADRFGFLDNSNAITVTNNSHPLAAGLPLGTASIYTSNGILGWGDPSNNNAIAIAHNGNPNQLSIFGYETGTTMDAGIVAPARRVAANLWNTPNINGENLFRAAIDWATGNSQPPVPTPGTLAFTSSTFSYGEDDSIIGGIQVERTGGSDGAVSAEVRVSYRSPGSGNASAADVVTAFPLTVNFADGDSATKTISLDLFDDTTVEGNEVFDISLVTVSGDATVDNSQNSVVVSIVDNDTVGTIGFVSNSFAVNEGDGVATLRVQRTGGSSGAQTVTLTPSNGTATAGADYEATPITVSYAAGEAGEKVVEIPIIDDSLIEGSENFTVALSGVSVGINAAATVAIADNDGGGNAVFIAGSSTLSGADVRARQILEEKGFTVTVVDDDVSQTGNATNQDLVVISQSVSSGKVGSKFTNVPIPVVVWESFLYDDLGMANSFNNVAQSNSVNIIDNSHPLAVNLPLGPTSIYNTSGAIGWGDPSNNNVIAVATTGNPNQLSVFGYETGVAMDAGIVAPARRVATNLRNTPTANGEALFRAAIDWATGNSQPSVPTPGMLAFTSQTFSYGEDDSVINGIQVERTGGSDGAVSAEVRVSYRSPGSGNASAADVVTTFPLTVNFADGDGATKSIPLDLFDDVLVEGGEVFDISLVKISGDATVDNSQDSAVVSILDNDAFGTIEFVSNSIVVNEGGGGATLRVQRTGGSAGPQTVTLTPSNGTATGGADYNATPITVNYAAGETGEKVVEIPIFEDSLVEGSESFTVILSGANVGSNAIATVAIADNDVAPTPGTLSFTASTFGYRENSSAINAIQVERTGGSDGAVSAEIQVSYRSPGAGNASLADVVTTFPLTVNFADGDSTTQNIALNLFDDAIVEGSEVFDISLVAVSGAATVDPNQDSAAVTIADNDGGNAVFIAGSSTLSGADVRAREILEEKGFTVTVVDDNVSQTSNALGQDLVVISQSVSSGNVGSKFTNVAVPVLVWESFLYDDLGMANSFNNVAQSNSINIIDNSHPLAANLPLGPTSIYNTSGAIGWGDPSNNNVIAVATTGNPNQLSVFGYETGVAMDAGIVAPARRVATNLRNIPDSNGEALFHAAIDWATGNSQPPVPMPGSIGFTSATFNYGEDDTVINGIQVERTGGSEGAVSAEVRVSYRSAGAGNASSIDVVTTFPLTVNFADGDSATKSIALDLFDDATVEGAEVFDISLVKVSGDAAVDPSQDTAVVNIVDNDTAGLIEFVSSSVTVEEGAGTAILRLLRSGGSAGALTVTLTSNDVTASAGLDYDATPIVVSYAAGESGEKTVELPILEDSLVEGSESFNVVLSGANVGENSTTTVNIADNEGGNAVFIAGTSTLGGADVRAREILEEKGFTVTVIDDNVSQTSNALGQDLIVISQSVWSVQVGNKFTNTAVPVIVWEPFLYDDLGMANGFGSIDGNSVTVTNNNHPLAGGLPLGTSTIYSGNGTIGWGDPSNNNAIAVANTGAPNQLSIFGYDTGTVMDSGVAPARRVAANFWNTPNANGEALFRAAIDWATEE